MRKGYKAIDCLVKKRDADVNKTREDKRGKSPSAHRVTSDDIIVHGLTAMAKMAGNTSNTNEWIIDSGTTHHISPHLTDFQEYHPLE